MDDREFGTVVFRNEDGGYGFARRDTGERDVFFHVSAINRRKVRIGDRVSFELSSDKHRRRCATNMRVVANEEGAQAEERQQMTADYDREERSALAQALRRAAGGEQA